MKTGDTQLLQVLIAKSDDGITTTEQELIGHEVYIPASASSFSTGSKSLTKKGILKTGVPIRRASSLTSGQGNRLLTKLHVTQLSKPMVIASPAHVHCCIPVKQE
jgi:hypothetical protein